MWFGIGKMCLEKKYKNINVTNYYAFNEKAFLMILLIYKHL